MQDTGRLFIITNKNKLAYDLVIGEIVKYSKGDCIEAIQYVADEVERSPSVSEYREHKIDSHPSISFIIREFGTWVNAKNTAGLKRSSVTAKFDKNDCIEAIQYVANKLDEPPTKAQYTEHRPDWAPSIEPVRNRFDSWGEAKKAAGLDPIRVQNANKLECLEALQYVAEKVGKSPTISQYEKNKPDTAPCSQVVGDRFGSWREAKSEAGLVVYCQDYTGDDCLEALQQIAKKVEGPLSKSQYSENKPSTAPSLAPLRTKFGSWGQAKREAGLEVQEEDYTKQECLEALQHVAGDIEKSPSASEYDTHKPQSAPSANVLERMFGSWNEAKQAVGFDVFPQRSYSEEECIEALQQVADEIGGTPSQTQYNTHSPDDTPSQKTIQDEFGSWNKAKEAAGLNVFYYNEYSEEECIEAIEYVTEKVEKSPTRKIYKNFKPHWAPSTDQFREQFGSWNEAKRVAGLITYRDGLNYPYGSNWREQRRAAMKRDTYNCVLCDIPNDRHLEVYDEELHIHHIYKLRLFYREFSDKELDSLTNEEGTPPELHEKVQKVTKKANHLSNLVTVCRECHLQELEHSSAEEQIQVLGVSRPKFHPQEGSQDVSVISQRSLKDYISKPQSETDG